MNTKLFIALALIVVASLVSSINGQLAHCLLRGTSYAKGLKGTVYFTQSSDGTTSVAWSIDQSTVPTALQGKTLGFHIHQFGYIADPTSTGSHYNPYGKSHALPSDNTGSDIHIGDLGNIDFSKGYSGVITSTLPQFNGTISVVGRAIRLHMAADLGKIAQPTGNASNPAAHCVIGIANNAANTMTYSDSYPDNIGVAVFQKTAVATTNVTGRVIFSYNSGTSMTRVYGKICGLAAQSTHGLHIHTYGELDLTDGTRTGGHFNPFNKTHGYPGSTERHVGDLGNVTADDNGIASFDFTVDLIELTGVRNIIGRGLVLHTTRDDGTSTSPTGNAGGRIAVAAIGIPNPNAVSLTTPNDACVDPAPAADVVTPTSSPKTSPKTSKVANTSSVSSFSVLLIALISLIASLL